MKNQPTINEIKEILEKSGIEIDDYSTIGWRVDDIEYKIGEEVSNSKDFDARNLEEAEEIEEDIEELDGTCSFGIGNYGDFDEALINQWNPQGGNYFDDTYIHIIAGEDGGYGQDAGERIIKEAVVIAKI